MLVAPFLHDLAARAATDRHRDARPTELVEELYDVAERSAAREQVALRRLERGGDRRVVAITRRHLFELGGEVEPGAVEVDAACRIGCEADVVHEELDSEIGEGAH